MQMISFWILLYYSQRFDQSVSRKIEADSSDGWLFDKCLFHCFHNSPQSNIVITDINHFERAFSCLNIVP